MPEMKELKLFMLLFAYEKILLVVDGKKDFFWIMTGDAQSNIGI